MNENIKINQMKKELPVEFIKLPNNKKILIITGPTASGKTALALKLARQYGGELVSADSRQIYRGMDIGTGKDIPKELRIKNDELSKPACGSDCCTRLIQPCSTSDPSAGREINVGYYEINKVKIWGLDLIDPNESFSVAQWVEFAKAIIKDIQKRNKLAIVVGGTGYWLRALVEGIEWGRVGPNEKIRGMGEMGGVGELREILKKYPKKFWKGLSASDWKNKRRLVRRIEVADCIIKYPNKDVAIKGIGKIMKILYIIKKVDTKELKAKIEQRINTRINKGLLKEITGLLKAGYKFSDPGMNSLGYREFKEYFIPHQSVQDCTKAQDEVLRNAIEQWKKDEIDYSRRQMVYIKKYFSN